MLIEFFGDYPRVRVMDLLISNPYSEFSKTDIAKYSKVSRNTLYSFFEKLEEYNLIKPGKKYGQTQLYEVNTETPAIKALNAFQLILAEIEIDKQMKLHDMEETADQEMDEDELEEIFNMVDEIIDAEILERQKTHAEHYLMSRTEDGLYEETIGKEIFNQFDSSQLFDGEELLFISASTSTSTSSRSDQEIVNSEDDGIVVKNIIIKKGKHGSRKRGSPN